MNGFTPYGLTHEQASYVIASANLAGQCDYSAGLLWVPDEASDTVYELVKSQRVLREKTAEYFANATFPSE